MRLPTECCLSSSRHFADSARPNGTSKFERADGGIGRKLNLLTFHGLDDMIHADTMLFILGLTFFVSVIAQTRLLEGVTFALLRRNDGAIVPTVISVTAFVAVASGVVRRRLHDWADHPNIGHRLAARGRADVERSAIR